MIVVEQGRRTGRTTSLLHYMRLEENSVLLVATKAQKDNVHKMYIELFDEPLHNRRVILPTDRQALRGHHHPPKFLIDNLEHVLAGLFGYEPYAVTIEDKHEL
jgi:hypothetical protein